MRIIILLLIAICCSETVAQQDIFSPENTGILPIFLKEPAVLRDLDLSEFKKSDFQEIQRKLQRATKEYVKRTVQAQLDPMLIPQLKRDHAENLVELANELSEILGPEKWQRLDQLLLRYQLNRHSRPQWFHGEFQAILNGELPNMKLDREVEDNLKSDLEEQQNELIDLLKKHKQEILELCNKHERRSLEFLDSEERRTFTSMFGDPMNFAIDRVRVPEKKEKPSR